MATKKPANYDANSIVLLKFPDNVRAKPSMYIGGTDSAAILHLVKEIVANSVDECVAGHGSIVAIHVTKTGKVAVRDWGRGVPVGPHPKHKGVDTLTLVFTELHAGGKMTDAAYKTSVGVHGVGSTAVNALSESFIVSSYRNEKWHTQVFAKGVPTSKVTRVAPKFGDFYASISSHVPRIAVGGTHVEFVPDLTRFDKGAKLNLKHLREWLDELAWLVPVKFVLSLEGQEPVVIQRDGLAARFSHELEGLKAEPLVDDMTPYCLTGQGDVDVLLGWGATSEHKIVSAVNAVRTPDHGTHYNALLAAIKRALDAYAKKGDTFTAASLAVGLIVVVNVRLHDAKFSSQDKQRLVDKQGEAKVAEALAHPKLGLDAYFKKHKGLARAVIDRANEITRLTTAFKASQTLAAAIKTSSRGKSLLPDELKGSATDDSAQRELYIVEGLSASGGCLAARDSHYQEILPLTGKIPNVAREEGKLATNKAIVNILKSIGFDPKNPTTFRVGKVCVLPDGDVDGPLHGSTRIVTLDGKRSTVKELVDAWERTGEATPLLGLDLKSKNKMPVVAVDGLGPFEVTETKNYAHVLLTDGTIITCTLDHKWAVNTPKGIVYQETRKLRPGSSLVSASFRHANSDGEKQKNQPYALVTYNGVKEPLHRLVARTHPALAYDYRKHKAKHGRFGHVHHDNEDTLDNRPSNLHLLTQREHWGLHGRQMASEYNGSEKQRRNLTAFWKDNSEARTRAAHNMACYNRSSVHRLTVAAQNADEDQKLAQALGRCGRHFAGLKALGLGFNEWDSYGVETASGVSAPKVGLAAALAIFSKQAIKAAAKRHANDPAMLVKRTASNRMAYPSQGETKFMRAWSVFIDSCPSKPLTFDRAEALFTAWRTKGIKAGVLSQGVPTWAYAVRCLGKDKLLRKLKLKSNHEVLRVEIVRSKKPEKFYCFTVPSTGNFFVSDKSGQGAILSKNCHVGALVLGLLYRITPSLFKEGRVFLVNVPLFIYRTEKQVLHCSSLNHAKAEVEKLGQRFDPQKLIRAKGLGEMPPEVLMHAAFDPTTRNLVRIGLPAKPEEQTAVHALLGEDPAFRKQLLGV